MPSIRSKKKQADSGKLRLAAVQMRFEPSISRNLEKIERDIDRAKSRRADVVLFPECALTGYGYDFSRLDRVELLEALNEVARLAAHRKLNVLLGTPVFGKKKLYNCLVHFDREGIACRCYAKCQLTPGDRQFFEPGDDVGLFDLDGALASTLICHERRYPELVRLATMAGARILFHPNAGMDALSVSKKKRGGRDGIPVRAFENAIYYVFANSVGNQGNGRWSAGDSKIVAPDGRFLALADNQSEQVIAATVDLEQATGKYAAESMHHPRFLRSHWKEMVRLVKARASGSAGQFELPKRA